MEHAQINFRLRAALRIAQSALMETTGGELDPGLAGVMANIDDALNLSIIPARYNDPTSPDGQPSDAAGEGGSTRTHAVRFMFPWKREPTAVDALHRTVAERNLTATEAEIRRLLVEMRKTGVYRRYILVGFPDIGPWVHTRDDKSRFEMTWRMGAVDEIPQGFNGQVFELTEEALVRVYALIDSKSEDG